MEDLQSSLGVLCINPAGVVWTRARVRPPYVRNLVETEAT